MALQTFLCKEPSVLSRVLCDSECPPHDVFHECSEFPTYYDALYFPQCHQLLFETVESVCQWLLSELHTHLVQCSSCPQLECISVIFQDNIHYVAPFFLINVNGIHCRVHISDIESSSFSFCRLHRHLLAARSMGPFTSEDLPSIESSLQDEEFVHAKVPSWINREEDIYFLCLSTLSGSELRTVVRSLPHSHLRSKADSIHTILQDFFHERPQFVSSPLQATQSSFTLASQYFHARYGPSVARALRDLREPDHFHDRLLSYDSICSHIYCNGWLAQSFKHMSSRLSHLSKQHTLQCLHSIPFYIRPSYSTRSIHACQSALLTHIRFRILYLTSLSLPDFLEAFFSVLPFDDDYCSPCDILVKRILDNEYGKTIVSNLLTSIPS